MRLKKRNILLFLFLVFFFSLRAVFDGDLGLHLTLGQQIFKNKSPIFGNPFGLYFQDYPYVYHSWLSQLVIFLIHHHFGLYGLSFAHAFLACLTIFVVLKICAEKGSTQDNLLFLTFSTPLVVFVSTLRVRAITFFFLGVLYLLLLKIEKGQKKLALAIPLLFAFWANLHGGFIMGLIFLLLWAIVEMLKFKSPTIFLLLFKMSILSFLFSLLNPYGMGVYTQSLKMIANPMIFRFNQDWQPLSGNSTAFFLGLFFAFLIFLFKEKISLRDQFLFFSLLFLSLFSSRFFLMVVLVFMPIFIQMIAVVKKKQWFKEAARSFLVLLALILCLLSIFLKQLSQITQMVWAYQSIENYSLILPAPLSFKAIKFIKEKDISEKMLNDYNWGGFLMWQLPGRKIFVDGRMDTFVIKDKPFLEIYWQMVNAEGEWEKILEKYEIEAVFLDKTFPLVKILPLLPEWKKIYEDDLAVIVVKK